MAYTKIIPVRSHLDCCLRYTANPEKTEGFSTEDMQRLLAYTQNGEKTERQLYVAGFNCDPAHAFSIMRATKRRWRKPLSSGVLGYHIIQSFRPGEVTPEQAFQIGCEFARRFLADRFECTVSTHLDRQHLHCHIVLNSVSFVDGRMFRNDYKTYYQKIRRISDELCRENALSVIETDGRGQTRKDWEAAREGRPTLRTLVREDVEKAMLKARSYEGFLQELESLGYQIRRAPERRYTTVLPPGRTKGIRLEKLDARYSEPALREHYSQLSRLPAGMQKEYREQYESQLSERPEVFPGIYRMRYKRRFPVIGCRKVTGFMALYYRYCRLLRRTRTGHSSRRFYYLLREDLFRFDRYRKQGAFLWEHKIQTMEELTTVQEEILEEIQKLTEQRSVLYRQKRREMQESAAPELDGQIHKITDRLRELRGQAGLCRDIRQDAGTVYERLQKANELACQEQQKCEVKINEYRWRSGRSDGPGGSAIRRGSRQVDGTGLQERFVSGLGIRKGESESPGEDQPGSPASREQGTSAYSDPEQRPERV